MKGRLKNFFIFIFLVLFNFFGGYIVSLLSNNQKMLYDSLDKPFFAVPSIVFPIVWSILYILLALAAFLNYKNRGKNFPAYFISMFINFSWVYIFFGQQLFGIGFIVTIILILFVIYLIFRYFKNSKVASFIMFLYLLWLMYASLLNYFIWMYNEM